MNDSNLSAADVMSLTRGNGNEMWNNPFIYLVWLAVLGGGGFGGLFGGGNTAMQGALTRADLSNGLNQQDIFRNQSDIMRELNAFERESANSWGLARYDNLAGVNSIIAALTEGRFDAAKCCCETNRNIDSIRYENAKNTCDIINTITSVINAKNTQELRDKLADRDRDLQTAELIHALRPVPDPAYITYPPLMPYSPAYKS